MTRVLLGRLRLALLLGRNAVPGGSRLGLARGLAGLALLAWLAVLAGHSLVVDLVLVVGAPPLRRPLMGTSLSLLLRLALCVLLVLIRTIRVTGGLFPCGVGQPRRRVVPGLPTRLR